MFLALQGLKLKKSEVNICDFFENVVASLKILVAKN